MDLPGERFCLLVHGVRNQCVTSNTTQLGDDVLALCRTQSPAAMCAGKVLEVGTPEEVFGRPRQERTRKFLEKILV